MTDPARSYVLPAELDWIWAPQLFHIQIETVAPCGNHLRLATVRELDSHRGVGRIGGFHGFARF